MMMPSPFPVDCHMHTPLCGHAVGEPAEFVEAALARGLQTIIFTCHIPMPSARFGGAGIRMDRDMLPLYRRYVEEARALGKDAGLEVRYGIEAEVFPDAQVMEWMDEILATERFDFILGSLHHQVGAYRDWLREHGVTSDEAIVRHYFTHLAAGARSGRYHSLAHPDVIRLYGTLRDGFEPERALPWFEEVVEAAVENDVCLELNTSGLFKGDYVMHPDPLLIRVAAEAGAKFTLGSDSHIPTALAQGFDQAVRQLRASGIGEVYVFNGGEREALPLPELADLPEGDEAPPSIPS